MSGYSSNSGWDDEDVDTRHPWLQSLWEARRSAREAYASIPPSTGADRTVFAPESQQLAHIFLVDYIRHLRPIAHDDDSLENLWADTVHESTIPKPGAAYEMDSEPMLQSTGGDTAAGVSLADAVTALPSVARDVSLENVLAYWDTQNEVRFFIEAPSGREVRSITISLSRGAIGECLQQADLCLHDLDWLPDAAISEYRAGDDEVLTH